MDIQQLKYFKAVATIGKINEAAESLFVSAPALSTSVSRLEKELGVRLFDRAGNRIVLNAQGKIFLKHTNQILSNLENAKLELQQSLAQHQNSISLISVNTVIWVELITAFTLESPDYTMACSATSIADLAENGLSPHCRFLLAYENEIPPAFNEELDSVFLFSANPVAMLHKDHPLANETVVSLSALANDKLFMPNPGSSLSDRLMQLFEHSGIPYPTDTFYSYVARQRMVASGMGVSFASQNVSHLFSANVRYIPLDDPFEPWVARLYWRKDHPLLPHEQAFLTFAQKFYGDLH